jgi:hypothetical protein
MNRGEQSKIDARRSNQSMKPKAIAMRLQRVCHDTPAVAHKRAGPLS